ncbi:MAG: hypothetical protein KJ944_08485, partial [Alphaproteobacteria bacterium]|nr:hypothetical protein [Alphaproteobacteria bacterium]
NAMSITPGSPDQQPGDDQNMGQFSVKTSAPSGSDLGDIQQLCDHELANKHYRQWIANGRQPLPLYDPEDGNDCIDEVLVRIASRVQSVDGRMRLTLEHHEPLRLFPGDTIFIRRSTPLRDQERR